MSGPDQAGEIVFWGEWEADSICEPLPTSGHLGCPSVVHVPLVPDPSRRPRNPQNTDPFVFGGRFLYTFCRQDRTPRMKSLQPGSVIAFGSRLGSCFVCDTVFVVADAIVHTKRSWPEVLAGHVPDSFLNATVIPMYTGVLQRDRSYTLYIGATPENPIDGMFSFVPCLPVDECTSDFARPSIDGLRGINPNSARAVALNKGIDSPAITECWWSVVDRVLSTGYYLGVAAELSEAVGQRGGR